MHRSRKIILIAHCVLNQSTVIREWERAKGAFNDIIKEILDHDIGILQLPCPEFTYLGEDRPPMTKGEYDTGEYRSHCRKLAAPFVEQLKEYIEHHYEIIGLIGIQGSPSCDVTGQRGVFMEEFMELLRGESLTLKVFEIPEFYIENKTSETVDCFREFINKAY